MPRKTSPQLESPSGLSQAWNQCLAAAAPGIGFGAAGWEKQTS